MSYLVDSNIIIYSCIPEHKFITDFILEHLPSTSIISKIEVLGYRNLSTKDIIKVNDIFNILNVIAISDDIAAKAIELRKNYTLKLADAIIAATALVQNFTLVTRNTKDFKKIKNLKLLNPFEK